MTTPQRALLPMILVASSACLQLGGQPMFERPMTRTFPVRDGSQLVVRVTGGSVKVVTTDADVATVTLRARARVSSEAEATEALSEYDVSIEQMGGVITASARRRDNHGWRRESGRVQFGAEVEVPAGVALDLETAGGSITVEGQRQQPLRAQTSGGSISVGQGAGLDLATSGGSIRVGGVSDSLRASTSGGSITVRRVNASARSVSLDTSGGSIRVGVDASASLRLHGQTSGGSVTSRGLDLTELASHRDRLTGVLNGGRGELSASTSGGSVTFARDLVEP